MEKESPGVWDWVVVEEEERGGLVNLGMGVMGRWWGIEDRGVGGLG